MVLEDTPFRDMTKEILLKVTEPKVEGSINLHELFLENTLDFFVFFSSVTAVLGNAGQSNYSAANEFMASLAEQRRQQGLAASIINIGPIPGVGYIEREVALARMETNLSQIRGYSFIAERDFLQLFAEAVEAGRPGSAGPIEITTGFRSVSLGDHLTPIWFSNPIMGNFLLYEEAADPAISNKKPKVPLKEQIMQAKS